MSASHTDISHRPQADGSVREQPCLRAGALNARDLLSQSPADSSSLGRPDERGSANQDVRSALGGASLAELMSRHLNKSAAGVGPALGAPSLGTLAKVPNSSPPVNSNQASLSLGTLAALNMSSVSQNSAPSLLSAPLGNLSLSNCKVTAASSSLGSTLGFGILSSAPGAGQNPAGSGAGLQSKISDTDGGPSLADLIQQHSKQTPPVSTCDTFTVPQLSTAFTGCHAPDSPAPATISLSELASQHHNRKSHVLPQAQERPPNGINFSKPTNPACSAGAVPSSQSASQHQQSRSLAAAQPSGADPPAIAPKLPPGFSASHVAPERKSSASSTSNGARFCLSALLSPEKSEGAPAFASSAAGGRTKCKRSHQDADGRPVMDLGALVAGSEGGSPSHFSYDLPLLSHRNHVFAQPSVFAITLFVRGQGSGKRRVIFIEDRMRNQSRDSESGAFQCQSRGKSNQHPAPLSPIVPFRFDTPSPDDTVRANQQKAFTR